MIGVCHTSHKALIFFYAEKTVFQIGAGQGKKLQSGAQGICERGAVDIYAKPQNEGTY